MDAHAALRQARESLCRVPWFGIAGVVNENAQSTQLYNFSGPMVERIELAIEQHEDALTEARRLG